MDKLENTLRELREWCEEGLLSTEEQAIHATSAVNQLDLSCGTGSAKHLNFLLEVSI